MFRRFFVPALLAVILALAPVTFWSPQTGHPAALMAQTSPQVPTQGNYIGFVQNAPIGVTTSLVGLQHFGWAPTGTLAAPATYTTATATAICATLGTLGYPGFTWDWWLYESAGAFTVTVSAGAGVTLTGTGTAATVSVRHFKWIVNNCSNIPALSLISLETSAY